MSVCGNTADMLSKSRFGAHFEIVGNKEQHFGIFDCAPVGAAMASPTVGGSISIGRDKIVPLRSCIKAKSFSAGANDNEPHCAGREISVPTGTSTIDFAIVRSSEAFSAVSMILFLFLNRNLPSIWVCGLKPRHPTIPLLRRSPHHSLPCERLEPQCRCQMQNCLMQLQSRW